MEEHDLGSDPRKAGGKADRMGRHRGRHAKGGTTHPINKYNAVGSPEVKEAEDREPGFAKGGRKARASGGIAAGSIAKARADRPSRASGGSIPKLTGSSQPRRALAKGGASNPYSSGRHLGELDNARPGRGYEGIEVPKED
jgi:hypothetical protein